MEDCKCKVVEKIILKEEDDLLEESFKILLKYNDIIKYRIHTLYDTRIIFVYERYNCKDH